MSGFLELFATCSVVGGARMMHSSRCEGLVVQAGIMRSPQDGTGFLGIVLPLRNPWELELVFH